MTRVRPSALQVVIASVCAGGCVASFALGWLDAQWVLWLALFLALELTAVVNRAEGATLSERIWYWVGRRPVRPSRWIRIPAVVLFLVELAAHLVLGDGYALTCPWAVVLSAVPLACVIGYSLAFERGRTVGLMDKAVEWAGLRWLKSKVSDKEGTLAKVLEALKGWKLVIAVLALFIVNVWDAMHNGHAGQIVASVLSVIGWLPSGDWTGEAMIKAAAGAVAILGMAGKLITAYKQQRAGAKVGELLTTNGYVKAAVADQGVRATLVSAGVPTAILKG